MKGIILNIFSLVLILFNNISYASEVNNQASNKNDDSAIYTEGKRDILVSSSEPQFTIKLKSNPSTGYAWFLRRYNATFLIPIKHRFQQGNNQLIGGSGVELWTFRVKPKAFLVPQQTVIRMIYARPWDNKEKSTEVVFHITTHAN